MANLIDDLLAGSIYSVSDSGAEGILDALRKFQERIAAMRDSGTLTPETLRRYYGARRFEQVAESNAIEGSTLSAGETELAVMKGVTLTGHDPGYVRDAVALDKALARLTELARESSATDIEQVKELHELICEGRTIAGAFRTRPVRITGSDHRPPKTWEAVMSSMEDWQQWSVDRPDCFPVLRASVLHAWLAHIHPFADGNGRTARAVTNLELVRAGYPPVIIRRKQDRSRYLDALSESDSAGDIGPFLSLVMERAEAALVGLEIAAREMEGFDAAAAAIRLAQKRKLAVWNKSVELLYEMLADQLAHAFEASGGRLSTEVFSEPLQIEEYLQLCAGRPVGASWAFRLKAEAPGLAPVERLAWVGYRSREMRSSIGDQNAYAPSIFWSRRNDRGYPPWVQVFEDAPGLVELSIRPGQGDSWLVIHTDGTKEELSSSNAAKAISRGFYALVARG